jgi:hypothetical protein
MYLWFSSKPAYVKKREKLELISATSRHMAINLLNIGAKIRNIDSPICTNNYFSGACYK